MVEERQTGAELLRARLRELGWNQLQFSAHIGVSTGVVSRWLSGERKPSLEMAFRIEESAVALPAKIWIDDGARRDADESGAHASVEVEQTGTDSS